MEKAPLEFLRDELPAHFDEGLARLRARGPEAAAALDDVLRARGAVRLMLDGEGELWLRCESGVLSAHAGRPEAVPVRLAIRLEAAVAKEALELLEGRMDDPEAPERFARAFSARAEEVIGEQKLEFHVVIRDVPDRDDVVIRVGVGTDTPPDKPQFTAAVSYDDLEDMRAGDLTPQQVIGRLRLTGDASKAMAIGMKLVQPPKK